MQSLNEQQYICMDIMKENNWPAPYFGIFLVSHIGSEVDVQVVHGDMETFN